MRYAVEMYFDKESENKIWKYIEKIKDSGLGKRYYDWGVKPHVSLGIFNDIDEDRADEVLEEFAKSHKVIPAYLGSVGIFPDSGAIYLAPIVREDLINLNKDLLDAMKELDPNPERWYSPGVWIPHCAVALELDRDNLAKAADIVIHDFEKLAGEFVSFGFVKVLEPSVEMKEYFFEK